ncbi:MAG: hypothetical protein H3C30_04110 [Candidatus Hydrogenedentes bacterium]|nr:hypothetical protein [Candidatus Hydrogenedentota bacterium]
MSLAEQFNGTPAGANRAGLAADFDGAKPAEILAPLPAGEYQARAVDARLDESRRGTPFYGMRLEIASGEHIGRRLVAKWYLSGAALPYSRRDLAALGLTSFAMLERGAVPAGLVRLRVALRRGDDGSMFNEVRAVLPMGNEAKPAPVAPAPAPVAAVNPEPVPPATTGDLPAGLVDDGLL